MLAVVKEQAGPRFAVKDVPKPTDEPCMYCLFYKC